MGWKMLENCHQKIKAGNEFAKPGVATEATEATTALSMSSNVFTSQLKYLCERNFVKLKVPVQCSVEADSKQM